MTLGLCLVGGGVKMSYVFADPVLNVIISHRTFLSVLISADAFDHAQFKRLGRSLNFKVLSSS